MTFQRICMIWALIFWVLAALYAVAPQVLVSGWEVAVTEELRLMARRNACGLLALGLIAYLGRGFTGAARKPVVLSVAIPLGAVALTGLYDLAMGHASWGILQAVVVEILLAAILMRAARWP